MATRASLKNFYEDRLPFIKEMIGQGFNEHPTIFTSFLNQKSADTGWIDVTTVSEYGLFAAKGEGQAAGLDEVYQGPTMRVKVLTYAKRTKITEEMIDDDLGDGIISNRVPGMAKSARATMEVLGHDVLNSAFGSTVTPDGLSLCNASHLDIGGTTQSNVVTSNPDLSQTSLQTAITQFRGLKNDRGIPIMVQPKYLIVSPAFEWVAKVILNSGQVVGSGNNDINPMASQNLQLIVSPYLTDSDAWFLLADQHDLNWYTRMALGNWSTVNEAEMTVEVGAKFRAATGASDWRGIMGSTGS
jgi:hypothetical protein